MPASDSSFAAADVVCHIPKFKHQRVGGLGIPTKSAAACRLKCVDSRYCKHWVHVTGWRVNCYLKSDRVTPERKEGATAGSIGVRCMSGGKRIEIT